MGITNYWKFDETSGDATDYVGSLPLTDNGGVGTAAGKINTARDFISIISQNLSGGSYSGGSFTGGFWFYADSLSSSPVPVCIYHNISNNYRWYVDISTTKIVFRVVGGFPSTSQETVEYTGSFSSSTWYLVLFKHDTVNKKISISVNGSVFTNTTYSSFTWSDPVGNVLRFGGITDTSIYGAPTYFDGRLDEAFIRDDLIDNSFASTIYNGGSGLSLSAYGLEGSMHSISSFSGLLTITEAPPGATPAPTEISYRQVLTTDTSATLSWLITDPDEGISSQQDLGDLQPSYEFDTGNVVKAWYDAVAINPTSTVTLDLTALPISIFGMSGTRTFSTVNNLTIENTSPSSYLFTGSSGISNSIIELGYQTEIGYSGIAEMISMIGFTVDSTHKNLAIRNPTLIKATCKILILGE